MVDDEFRGHQRVDLGRILAEGPDRVTHGGQVYHRRYTGEILHQHACRMIGNLHRFIVGFLPAQDMGQVRFLDDLSVELAQEVLHQDADGVGQVFDRSPDIGGELIEVEIGVALAIDIERLCIVRVFHDMSSLNVGEPGERFD